MHIQTAREGIPRLCPGVATAGGVSSWVAQGCGHSQGPARCPSHCHKQKQGNCSMSFLVSVLSRLSSSHLASESHSFLCIASLIVYTAFSASTVPRNTKSVVYFLSSGRFGLWLDADLYHGRSNSCSTFNNDILTKKEDFIIQDVEVWTFE